MTAQQKLLAFYLLTGENYLRKISSCSNKRAYKMYTENQVLIQYFKRSDVSKDDGLLKINNLERITINLNLVRQLDGRSYIKKLYKNLQTTINISAA